jgi:hypothetical protein
MQVINYPVEIEFWRGFPFEKEDHLHQMSLTLIGSQTCRSTRVRRGAAQSTLSSS